MKKTELISEFLHGSTESFQWITSTLLGGVPCLSQGLYNRWLLTVWVTFHSSLHPRTSCVSLRGVHITNSHKTQKLAAKVVSCGTVTKKGSWSSEESGCYLFSVFDDKCSYLYSAALLWRTAICVCVKVAGAWIYSILYYWPFNSDDSLLGKATTPNPRRESPLFC